MSWGLPSAVSVEGVAHEVYTDYRDILEIINVLNDQSEPEQTRLYIALNLFFKDFSEIDVAHRAKAAEAMMIFINCGERETDARPSPKRIDWKQDEQIIAADINKAAGCEVRALPYLHWWTFISYFNAVGDGQLSTLVSIREKLRKRKKLDDWEKEYYRENKARVDFRKEYTAEELAEKERLLKIIRGDK